jgi:hypothetical protein
VSSSLSWCPELAATPIRTGDLLLFCALLAAAVICIEAMRRLGQPSGVSRDLLSAWWLPIALLLPPLYALLAPFAVGAVLYARARRIPVYRRGVAVLGQHGNDLFELLAAADVALYRAKDVGRDQVRVYAHAAGNAQAAETKDQATDACP